MWDRSSERNGVLEHCQKEGLAFMPWSPLGGADKSAGDKGMLRDPAVFPNLNGTRTHPPPLIPLDIHTA